MSLLEGASAKAPSESQGRADVACPMPSRPASNQKPLATVSLTDLMKIFLFGKVPNTPANIDQGSH